MYYTYTLQKHFDQLLSLRVHIMKSCRFKMSFFKAAMVTVRLKTLLHVIIV